MSNKEIPTGYELSRQWFDFSFENPSRVRPIHSAIYFFAIEHCNRLGWKKEFGFPSQMAMEAIGVNNWRTYIKAFSDLVDWGFFKLIQKSKNQHSSNIIAIVKNTKAHTKALDKALQKHSQKQVNSTVSIYKPINNEPLNKEPGAPVGANDSDLLRDSKEIATYLLKAIQDYDPTHRFCQKIPNVDGWARDVDRAIRLDGRTKDGLKHMIHIIFYENVSGVSDFWAGNIESGKKLREQFDKIKNQLKQKGYGKRQKTADIIDSMYTR